MDTRKRLEVGNKLLLKGIDCTIDSVVGAGSNAIVYSAWYYDELNTSLKHYVLIKELFPYHPKGGIFRDENNCIVVSDEAREYYDLHKQSFEYGNGIHLTLLQKYPEKTGANINTYSLNNTLYTVLGFSGGRSLETEIKSGNKKSLKEAATLMLGILDCLESFHNQSFLHMDISWDNVLVIGKGEYERYMLIDYNSVHNIGLKTDHSHEYFSAKPGFSAPEVRNGQIDKISKASDLYSVGAVFYAVLTGSVLTPMQLLRRTPPDVSGTKLVSDMPETVKDMVRKILCKSLATLPDKRYQSVSEMAQDLHELIDRIDGVGITHWALWEAGRKNILNAVKINTALEYISNKDMLYPIDVLDKDRNRIRIEEAIKNVSENKTHGIVLKGAGGSGKTTALLKCIYYQSGKYSSLTPAFTYVSLYGADESNSHYIKNKILENLHFKADTRTFEMARHKLLNLLKEPLGDRPKLVIMLDGFNEVSGNKEKLIKEIDELLKLEGVGIILSTRSFSGELSLDEVSVLPLKDEEVLKVLSKDGLLIEDNGEIRELLKTPLMLSIYTETAKNKGGQINVTTKDELIGTYLENLCDKEIRNMPDGDSEKWLIDASVKLLLPAIAGKIASKNRALSDTELLKPVEKCYRIFSSVLMSRAFPRWIGHTKDIKAGTKSADEWYGKAVHDILWQRMGLLTKEEHGNYRTSHQIIEEYLVKKHKENTKKLRTPKIVRIITRIACIIAVIITATLTLDYLYPDLRLLDVFTQANTIEKNKARELYAEKCKKFIETEEKILDSAIYAVDYAESFFRTRDWDSLKKARAACSVAIFELQNIEKLEPDMPQKDVELLEKIGINVQELSGMFNDVNLEIEAQTQSLKNIQEYLHGNCFTQSELSVVNEEVYSYGKYCSRRTNYIKDLNAYMMMEGLSEKNVGSYTSLMQDFVSNNIDSETIDMKENYVKRLDEMNRMREIHANYEQAKKYPVLIGSIYPTESVMTVLPMPSWVDFSEAEVSYGAYNMETDAFEGRFVKRDFGWENMGYWMVINNNVECIEIKNYLAMLKIRCGLTPDIKGEIKAGEEWTVTYNSGSLNFQIGSRNDTVYIISKNVNMCFVPEWYYFMDV